MSEEYANLIDKESPSNQRKANLRACLAELVGVALFVFIGTMAVGSTKAGDGTTLAVAAAHGLTIGLLIAGFGELRSEFMIILFVH